MNLKLDVNLNWFQNNMVVSKAVSQNLADGRWHLVIVSVLGMDVTFYVDGINIGTRYSID